MWCMAELTPEYIEKMEDTLGIYEKPYDPGTPGLAGYAEIGITGLMPSAGLCRAKGKTTALDQQ